MHDVIMLCAGFIAAMLIVLFAAAFGTVAKSAASQGDSVWRSRDRRMGELATCEAGPLWQLQGCLVAAIGATEKLQAASRSRHPNPARRRRVAGRQRVAIAGAAQGLRGAHGKAG